MDAIAADLPADAWQPPQVREGAVGPLVFEFAAVRVWAFAFSGMLQFGISASLLSLGAIDFGMIVDSSVVMVENCVRHIAHGDNRRRPLIDVGNQGTAPDQVKLVRQGHAPPTSCRI